MSIIRDGKAAPKAEAVRPGDRDWQVSQDQFVATLNQTGSLAEAAAKLKELADGNVPRWLAMVWATLLRQDEVKLKLWPSRKGNQYCRYSRADRLLTPG